MKTRFVVLIVSSLFAHTTMAAETKVLLMGPSAEAIFNHLTGAKIESHRRAEDHSPLDPVLESRRGENVICTSELTGQEPAYPEYFCELKVNEDGKFQ